MPYIYSTLTCDNEYVLYKKGGADIPVVETSVLIKGGANLATKRGDTPPGAVTIVTDGQLAALEQNPVFQTHVENGFIIVSKSKPDVEVVAADMTSRAPDAPIVPEDYDPDSKEAKPTDAAPRTNPRKA